MSNICNYIPDPNILTQAKVNREFLLIHKHLCYLESQGGGGSSFYQTIQRNGSPVTQRPILNFGTQFGVADDAGNTSTDITITSIAAGIVSGLATVATTGSYNDLSNKPTIPTIGGSDTQVQYNNAGSFAGSANLTWTNASSNLTVTGLNTTVGNNLATTQTATVGQLLTNNTAATNAVQVQISPATVWQGNGWASTPAASQTAAWRAYTLPAAGTANPTSLWVLQTSTNGAAYSTLLSVSNVMSFPAEFIGGGLRLNGGGISMTSNSPSGSGFFIQGGFGWSIVQGQTLVNGSHWSYGNSSSLTANSGTECNFAAWTPNIANSAGSSAFNILKIGGTYNTTGTYTGITRGLYINPTLTNAPNYRALEISAGKTILGASTTTAASLNIPSGTAPTSPNNGDIWFDGTSLHIQIGGVTKTFTVT